MPTWICLLRGIGGKYTLPSAMFVEILESLHASETRTYIATGNAVFRSRVANGDALAKKIGKRINAMRGFEPKVLLLTLGELEEAVANNPYPEAERAPTTLHLMFLPEIPANPDLAKLESVARNGETFVLSERVLYLHTPAGMAASKIAPQLEKRLGVWGTARNWRSACRILELAKAIGA